MTRPPAHPDPVARPVSEAIAGMLADRGVEVAFGLTGNSNLSLAMAMTQHGTRFITARHESAAVSMADGWARRSRRTGVCTVTRGPGLTNAVTGLVEAHRSRTPLLFIGGNVPASAIHHNQMLDHEAVLTSLGIATERIRTPATAVTDLARAFDRCSIEQRPVGVFIRPELLRESTTESPVVPPPKAAAPVLEPPPDAVTRLRDALATSAKPVIVAGRGAAAAGDPRPYVELADRVGALLATTAPVKGFFRDSPRNIGICGGFASRGAKSLLRQADLVVAFGASLNEWTMGHGQLFPEARVVLVDTDPSNLGRLYPLELGVHADATRTAGVLHAALTDTPLPGGFDRSQATVADGQRSLASEFDDQSDEHGVDPRSLMIRLDALLPPDRLLVTDSGHFMGFPMSYLSVPDERSVIFPQAYQAMGVGLGNAIGAAVASPGRVVAVVVGDGGLMMMPGDLETAVRLQLPMLVVVINDAAFGAEYHHLAIAGVAAPDAIVFGDVAFADVARSLGARAVTVRAVEDLAAISSWIASPSGPLLVDVKTTRAVRADWFDEAWNSARPSGG